MIDVNAVIDGLARKLGVASEVLIPEMSRFYITKDLTAIIITAVIFITCIICILKIIKHIKTGRAGHGYFEDDPWIAGCIVLAIIGFFTLIVFLVCLSDLVGFVVSPMGATISTIIESLSK